MSNEIQPDPSNHPHEHEPQATSKLMSQEIQSDPSSNHPQDPELKYFDIERWNRIAYERMADDREKYHKIGLPLYEASIKCDWKTARAILDMNPHMNLLRCSISQNGDTALHIAASAKAPKKKAVEFVRNLVERMEPKDLELVNNNKSTALYLAVAAGNTETVKIMMKRNPTLDMIPGGGGDMMPLYAAVLFGNRDVAEYLYERSDNLEFIDGWTYEKRESLLEKCVESDMFDIAIQIVKKYPKLGRRSIILELLARKPEAFYEMKYSNTVHAPAGTPVEKNSALGLLKILWEDIVKQPKKDVDDILRGRPDSIKSGSGRIVQTIQLKQLIFYHLDKLVEETQTIKKGTLTSQKLKDLVSKHVVNMHVETQSLIKQENTTDEDQALDLQKLISEYIVKLHDETTNMPIFPSDYENRDAAAQRLLNLISDHIKKLRAEIEIIDTRYSSRVMFIAAEVGNTNFLLELIRGRSDLIRQVDDNGLSIFHVAVKHRHEGIYNLLYEIGSMKDTVTSLEDKDGNNMLHLAAMRTRKKNLSLAALQMQRDLLWFKEVERMIPPYLRVIKNKDGFTPRELFTNEHQDLVEQGEESLKLTANQCMVVATLVATIVFAAAFTVPGGYNQSDGIPMFNQKLSFAVFVVADAMSLFLSSISILIFTSFFVSSGYTERDFEELLPMKLMSGILTLYVSIGAMLVTYSVNFFVIYHKEMKWIHIFFSLFAFTTASWYFETQVHLLNDVFRTIYAGKYLFKPKNQVLFYENPRF